MPEKTLLLIDPMGNEGSYERKIMQELEVTVRPVSHVLFPLLSCPFLVCFLFSFRSHH